MSDQAWFIDPSDIVEIKLSTLPGDQWIKVKRELGFAEEQALAGSMMGDFKASGAKAGAGKVDVMDASVGFDMKRYQIERFVTWIVDWSAKTKDGKSIEVSRDAVAVLRPVVADAIDKALDAHVEALEAAKKAPSGNGAQTA